MKNNTKSAVITGGAGFIGSHVAERLVREGWAVKIVDNFSSGFRSNLQNIINDIELIEGSITDRELMNSVMTEGCVVWHFAAMNSVPRSIDHPWDTNHNNINGTLSVLLAAKDNNAKRVVYSASSSAYGNIDAEFKSEEMPANPLSPYAVTKFTGEQYCKIFSDIYGMETISLRYFNVFGPKQNPTSPYSAVIPLFMSALMSKSDITVFGDGQQSRDFTYIDNVVHANFLAGTKSGASAGTYNVACGSSTSINAVISLIEKQTGYKYTINNKEPRMGDVRSSKASIKKISASLGYKPIVEFKEGLYKTIKWYIDNPTHFDNPN